MKRAIWATMVHGLLTGVIVNLTGDGALHLGTGALVLWAYLSECWSEITRR